MFYFWSKDLHPVRLTVFELVWTGYSWLLLGSDMCLSIAKWLCTLANGVPPSDRAKVSLCAGAILTNTNTATSEWEVLEMSGQLAGPLLLNFQRCALSTYCTIKYMLCEVMHCQIQPISHTICGPVLTTVKQSMWHHKQKQQGKKHHINYQENSSVSTCIIT